MSGDLATTSTACAMQVNGYQQPQRIDPPLIIDERLRDDQCPAGRPALVYPPSFA
jgi:hypothetical protein